MSEKFNSTVLVAPLDWGLGHATRCIPIINHLTKSGCNVIIATDGIQEKLLKKEFPALRFVKLPGYAIKYSKNKRLFPLKIIAQIPKILKAIKFEQKWLKEFLSNNSLDLVISDNRYGLFNPKISSIFITHQLLIKAPLVTVEKLLQKINYRLVEKFSECWVPDIIDEKNMAGRLSHPARLPKIPVTYIGGLSRLEKQNTIEKHKILIIISGPEPQRTLLEKVLLKELKNSDTRVVLVRGLPGSDNVLTGLSNVVSFNHLAAKELENVMNESDIIICRSGYTTIMDIFKLKKKAVLIPTPGQTEQEYLAKHLQEQHWCLSTEQHNFNLNETLMKARSFHYLLPDLNMNIYQKTIDSLILRLETANSDKFR